MFLVILGAWTVIYIFATVRRFIGAIVAPDVVRAPGDVNYSVVNVLCWTILTFALFALVDRHPFDRFRWRSLPVTLLVLAVITVWRLFFEAFTFSYFITTMPGKEIFRQYLLTGVDRAFLDTMVVWLIGQALRVQRLRHVAALRASELSKQLAVAQLDNLRAQLQPHFLFNTLNSVAALVGEDAGRARTMIARLSELLRLSLQTMSEKLVTLAEELEIVSRYIEIQRLRFDDSMSFTVDVAGDCLDAAVPPFLLQPLVENSIKHGMDSSRRCCAILLQARRSGDALRIEITNDAETAPGPIVERVGLFNTRARLQAVYGDACSLTIGGVAGASVTATIVLPFMQQRPAGRLEEPVLV